MESAILSFIRRESPVRNRTVYEAVTRIAFAQPRKVLANNLATDAVPKPRVIETLERMGLSPQARPQDLSVELLEQLAQTGLWQ